MVLNGIDSETAPPREQIEKERKTVKIGSKKNLTKSDFSVKGGFGW
jgi:hypothetical protein